MRIQCSLKSRYTTSSPSKLNYPASNAEAKILAMFILYSIAFAPAQKPY